MIYLSCLINDSVGENQFLGLNIWLSIRSGAGIHKAPKESLFLRKP
jgi:hypothetical protein